MEMSFSTLAEWLCLNQLVLLYDFVSTYESQEALQKASHLKNKKKSASR